MSAITYLIPLYNSAWLADIISENVDAILKAGHRVVLSDRNGNLAVQRLLEHRFARAQGLTCLAHNDDGDWVDNINGLIAAVRTPFFQILPHDDTLVDASGSALIRELEKAPDAVLAYGCVEAIDLSGQRLPHLDSKPNPTGAAAGSWILDDWLDMFWTGRFPGAFKGLVRTSVIHAQRARIRKTRTLSHSERTWLFGLCLLGRFVGVDTAMLTKRYYDASTSRVWDSAPETFLHAADTMAAYCDDFIKNDRLRSYVVTDLRLNASARHQSLVKTQRHCRYIPSSTEPIRHMSLVGASTS